MKLPQPGLFDLIQFASGLVLAIPMAIIGLERIGMGDVYFGAAFLLLSVILLFLPEYVTRRIGTPRDWIRRRLPFRGEK